MPTLHEIAERVPQYPGRKAVERVLAPMVGSVGDLYAGHVLQRVCGFWLLTHACGGWAGLRSTKLLSEPGAYKQRRAFRVLFGCDAEDFEPELGRLVYESAFAEALLGKDVAALRPPLPRAEARAEAPVDA